jgi:hypothetical protein
MMSHDYLLGYVQGRRGRPLLVSGDTQDDIDYRAGYRKGADLYAGEVLMHKQLVSRYNNG